MPGTALPRQLESSTEARDQAVMVDVVVLSTDMLLFDAIRAAIGERNPVWRARSAEESVDMLLTGRCGVLLVDLAAVSTQPATLVEQIVEQFPDVVVVVAGRREDEALLAQLISEGLVYRFMHKPLSAKRAGMFLQAATRCHVERRDSSTKRRPLLPLSGSLPKRTDRRKWLFVAVGVALFAGLIGLLPGSRSDRATSPAAATPARSAPADSGTRPQADPVLSRARAAFQAGRYESPAGRNALDLYAAVLLADQSQPEARDGLDKTVAKVVAQARTAAASGEQAEAQRLLGRLQAVAPGDAATTRLAALLAPPPAPAVVPEPSRVPVELAGQQSNPVALATTRPSLPPVTTPVARQAMPTVPPRAAARATIVSDPLAPRYSNAGKPGSAAAAAARRRNGTLIPGAPVRGLPTAGYVRDSYREPPVAKPEAPDATNTGAFVAPAEPAGSMDRIVATDPVYPASARQGHVEGWVELMFTITETGSVRDVEVVDAEPRGVFESAAAQAVGSWRYRPRLANGQPVPRRTTVTLRFNLDD
jgi:TonB family protein